jgi:hypothetical protein
MALSGRVEAVGAKVTTLQAGDEVYGDAPAGAFAEYAIVPAELLAPKPATCRSKRQPRPHGRSHRSRHWVMWEVSRPARRY